MSHDADDRSVEFVVGAPDDALDEELVEPAGFPRLRRARLPLLVAGAVALVAVVAIDVARGSSGTPSAAPTVTVSPQASTAASPTPTSSWSTGFSSRSETIIVEGRGGGREPLRLDLLPTGVPCPTGASCAILVSTPSALAAAVRRALPSANHLYTATTLEHADVPGSRLLARRVTARAGAAHLTISVRAATRDDTETWNASETPARTLVTVRDLVLGDLVTLRLTAPPGYGAPIDPLRRLAADAALVDIG